MSPQLSQTSSPRGLGSARVRPYPSSHLQEQDREQGRDVGGGPVEAGAHRQGRGGPEVDMAFPQGRGGPVGARQPSWWGLFFH